VTLPAHSPLTGKPVTRTLTLLRVSTLVVSRTVLLNLSATFAIQVTSWKKTLAVNALSMVPWKRAVLTATLEFPLSVCSVPLVISTLPPPKPVKRFLILTTETQS
jgi:hypothetical protein